MAQGHRPDRVGEQIRDVISEILTRGDVRDPGIGFITLTRVQARSDGELRWIVSNGIRMTGMPAFGASRSEEEVWQLVAALRRLPTTPRSIVRWNCRKSRRS